MPPKIPEALDYGTTPFTLIIKQAQRKAGLRSEHNTPPRALIMNFLNYNDKNMCGSASYVLPTEIHKQRLWAKAIRYGIIFSAGLKVFHGDCTYIFDTPAKVEHCLEKLGNGPVASPE